jgi:hypothetical protein
MVGGRSLEILGVCGNNAMRVVSVFVKVTALYSRIVWEVYCYIA